MRRLLLLAVLSIATAFAHVGSPDIFLDATAGPYKLFVTVRPPNVIPGVAELEIRSETAGVKTLKAVPLPLSGPGAEHAPTPDVLKASEQDPQFFAGSLWLMAPGSWQVKVWAEGAQGSGVVSVPVPSIALKTKTMDAKLGAMLATLMVLLAVGLIAMVRAAVRDSERAPGTVPTDREKRSAWRATAVATAIVIGVIWFGGHWWNGEALAYSGNVFKPLNMTASERGGTLTLKLSDPGWIGSDRTRFAALPAARSIDDLIPDHNHLMHLYMIRQPGLDVAYHLHPEQTQPGEFQLPLPNVPGGEYKLYADIVHESGLPETPVASIRLGDIGGRPLAGDDAAVSATPYSQASATASDFQLPDGYTMRWERPDGPLHARRPYEFRFQLLTPDAKAPPDMQLYMGMLGHAAFVKPDGSVFAHIHPTGSVSMPAFLQANHIVMDHSKMHHQDGNLPNEVGFPYGLPSPGRYRIFVQMKHGATVETGVFDTNVD